jgi:vanillate O-demethylase ferredoxin subunit
VPGGLVRRYSLWNDASDPGLYRIGVLKEVSGRGGSRAMHDTVMQGDVLTIGAPRNQFALVAGAPRSLLMAGGIGITPMLCMAQELARRQEAFEFHYSVRSAARAAFLDRLAVPALHDHVRLHFDDGDPDQRLQIQAVLQSQPAGTHLYVCGPKGFMDAVLQGARNLGWPEELLHYEFFQADAKSLDGDAAFDVRLARSGRIVRVAADRTVVQALAAAGVDVPVSCEQGICGTCVTTVLAGRPDHRDSFLLPQERAAHSCFTPCCSRSLDGELVLDL